MKEEHKNHADASSTEVDEWKQLVTYGHPEHGTAVAALLCRWVPAGQDTFRVATKVLGVEFDLFTPMAEQEALLALVAEQNAEWEE